jgi:predicted ATPase
MSESQFIGREDKLQYLRDLMIEGIKLHGCTIFIEGTTGMGKRRLLEEFRERARADPELHGSEFILVQCDQNSGSEDAYHPFIEVLETFEKPENKGKEIAKKAIKIIQETAPDWLNIVPVFGPAITAGVKTAAKVVDATLTNQNDIQADKARNLPRQYEKAILGIASNCTVLVLMIADAQWIDKSSCNLLERLARSARNYNLLLLVTCSSETMDHQHPLRKIRVNMLMDQIAERIILDGLTVEEINSYLRARFGQILEPLLAEWLRDLCNGEPWFVIQYLDFLQQQNIITEYGDGDYKLNGRIRHVAEEWEVDGQLKDALRSAENIDELLEMRLSTLTKEELEVLKVSAVQGKRFLDIVLAKLLSKERDEIKSRLDEIEKKHRLIRYLDNDQEWERLRSDVYSFVQTLIQQRFYNELTHTYRADYHCEIAKTLEEILNDDAFKQNYQPQLISRQKLMIQIARHFDLGNSSLSAAKYYFEAAQSSFYNGALKEASDLCNRALQKVRSLPEGDISNDQLYTEIIQIKILASEIWWRGKPTLEQSRPEEETLIEEAEAAALRTGNKALIANIKHLKGKIFVATHNLDGAVEALEEALQVARDAKDPLTESFILSDLGHHIVGRRSDNYSTKGLDYGLDLQYQAHQLLEDYLKINVKQDDVMTDLTKHFYLIKASIGIGEFDRGNYGKAMKWLEVSKKGLEQIRRRKDLAWPLNFLGQVYTAVGLFEDAEKVLQEAIELHSDDEDPSAVRANNKALLGKLYMEQGRRIIDAEKPILEAWNEIEVTWNVSVVAVIRNYYTELLMHPEFTGRDLVLAEEQIKATIKEVETTKFYRSAIVAFSLWGKLALMQGDIQAAVQHSTNAITYIDKMGSMPLLRMEEIFFNHYSILKAAEDADAKNYLDRAYITLKRKADSIGNKEYERKFLEQVPVSSAIINAVNIFYHNGSH